MLLDATSPFSITVCWTLTGDLPANASGTFLLRAYAEPIVPSPARNFFLGEVEIPTSQVTAGARAGADLRTIIPVPQGVPARGYFKLTAVMIHQENGRPTGLRAFLDGPVIEFVG